VDEVNYVDFCRDIDSLEQLFGVGTNFNQSTTFFPKSQPRANNAEIERNCPSDTEDILARLRQVCSQRRTRISEFFRDFDRLRSGIITAAQFRIGLNMAKVAISNQEFKMLCHAFQANKQGEHFRWRDFSDQVDEVFTKKGLEKNLDLEVGLARTQTKYTKQEADEQQRARVQQVVEQFADVVRKNRLDAKSFFQDRDRHRHFKVSPAIFRQVMTGLGFPLSEEQVREVALVYGEEDLQIRYAEFLRDSNVLEYVVNGPTTGAKSTYKTVNTDF